MTMAHDDLNFRKMRLKHFEQYYEVGPRHACRKRTEMRILLGLEENEAIYFPQFCKAVNKPPEVVRAFFGW